MKKTIIRDFVEVLLFIGADYRHKFRKQSIGKAFTVVALIILTAIFASMSIHFGVFKFGFNDAMDFSQSVVGIVGGVIIMLIIFGLAAVLVGATVAMPIADMWFYISERHGKQQHIINVFLFVLCVAFLLYTTNLVHILEHLSGEAYHGVNTLKQIPALLFILTVFFGTWSIFCWLSGISEAWTYTIQQIITMEEAKLMALKEENPEKYFHIRYFQSNNILNEKEQLEMIDLLKDKIEQLIIQCEPVLCEKALSRLFDLPNAAETLYMYICNNPLPDNLQMRAFEMPENEAKLVILQHQRRFGLCKAAAEKVAKLGWKYSDID